MYMTPELQITQIAQKLTKRETRPLKYRPAAWYKPINANLMKVEYAAFDVTDADAVSDGRKFISREVPLRVVDKALRMRVAQFRH